MSDFKKYRRTNFVEMRPYEEGEQLSERISISPADKDSGSPKKGDMIARNPANPEDQWLVSKEYFDQNYELMAE